MGPFMQGACLNSATMNDWSPSRFVLLASMSWHERGAVLPLSIGKSTLCGCSEGSCAENLVHFPFDELEGTVTSCRERVARGNSFGF